MLVKYIKCIVMYACIVLYYATPPLFSGICICVCVAVGNEQYNKDIPDINFCLMLIEY